MEGVYKKQCDKNAKTKINAMQVTQLDMIESLFKATQHAIRVVDWDTLCLTVTEIGTMTNAIDEMHKLEGVVRKIQKDRTDQLFEIHKRSD